MIYAFIEQLCNDYPVVRLCAILGVSKSGYHVWRVRPISRHAREDGELTQAIEACYHQSRQAYGSPRVYVHFDVEPLF